MRGTRVRSRRGRTAVALLGILLAGCTAAGPAPAAPTPSTSPLDISRRPPAAGDLTPGVPIPATWSANHGVIVGSVAYHTLPEGIERIDLATGSIGWLARFPASGTPWDGLATVAATEERVYGMRTVDTEAGARLQMITIDPDSGAVTGDGLVSDPGGSWRVDLPPAMLAADDDSLVIASNPEWDIQTGVISLPDRTVTWIVDEQALAADAHRVVTRTAVRDRSTGVATGAAPATIGRSDSDECVRTAGALICLAEDGPRELGAVDAVTGARLWSADATDYEDLGPLVGHWLYLWTDSGTGTGDALDARTGRRAVSGIAVPRVRESTTAGIVIEDDAGWSWLPTTG